MPRKYDTLPFLLGLSRVATRLPQGLEGRMRLDEAALAAHSDRGLGVVFDLPVAARVQARVHRYACDVTRDPEDTGDQGAVPFRDRDGEALYDAADRPGAPEVSALVETFHGGYHGELAAARMDEDLLLHLEVRAMEEIPAVADADRDRFQRSDRYRRPQICLANHGGPDGGPVDGGYTSCPREAIVKLARCLEARDFQVLLNNPYRGGWDLEHHGRRWFAGIEPVPVVLLAITQELYLSHSRGIYDPDKGAPLKARLRGALEEFADYLLQDEVHL